jgi:hypothetical protein
MELAITSATSVLTGPDERMTVTVRVANHTGLRWVGDINLGSAREPFADREALTAWPNQGLEDLGVTTYEVKALEGQQLESGQEETFTLEATASAMRLGKLTDEPGWGPRGMVVSVESASRKLAAEWTYVVYAPPEAITSQLNLSVVVGLTSGSGESREQTLDRLGQVAEATSTPWISWLADPALLIANGNGLAASTEGLAQSVTEAVEAGKAVYQLPYQDVDEAALTPAGVRGTGLLETVRQIGRPALASAVGEDTAAQMSTSLAWASRPVNQGSVDLMAAAGSDAVLLDPNQFAQAVPQAVTRSDGRPTSIATDRDLTGLLSGKGRTLDLNQALAQTALDAQRSQTGDYDASLVVAMPRDWTPDQDSWGILRRLEESAWIRPTPLPTAIDRAASRDRQLIAEGDSGLSAQSVSELLDLTDQAVAFSSLTPDPAAYVERALPPLLVPLSNALPISGRQRAINLALTDAATAVPPVSVVVGSEVNLISGDGKVPVVVQNTSNEHVSGLVVDLVAHTNAIQTGDPDVLSLGPGQQATARVQVHAVANGVFRVQIGLLDASGKSVAEGGWVTMRVRAEWENVTMGVIGGVLALVFAVGVIMTVRKRRAQARGEPDADGDNGGDESGEGDVGSEPDSEPTPSETEGHGARGSSP